MIESIYKNIKGLSKHAKKKAINVPVCTALVNSTQVIEKMGNLRKKYYLTTKPPQHIVRDTNMQPTRLSKSRSSKSPPYKSGTHCTLLICIILILASSLSFFSEKEKSTSISED